MQKLPENIIKLAKISPAVKKQFFCGSSPITKANDPLLEDTKYQKIKGLIHKYPRRVLIILSKQCGAYCSFCSRKRFLNDLLEYQLTNKDLENIASYIKKHKEIKEVILSGGDPLMAKSFYDAIDIFAKIEQIKIIRIHTRAILSAPQLFTKNFFAKLKNTKKTIYISFHINHAYELTSIAKKIIKQCKDSGFVLLTQTVFLKGINDSAKTLESLFSQLSELGVMPYYIHHCDKVDGLENFTIPIKKEIAIMTELEKKLSGVELPKHVVDAPFGNGKIPIPQNFWKFDYNQYKDYKGKTITMH
jgi:lysine 2,3-aminomutase